MLKSNYSIIDIGSNSVRSLQVKNGKPINQELKTTRLIEGMDSNNYLNSESINRTILGIKSLIDNLDSQAKIYAFATEAVRASKNSQDFLCLVKNELQVDIEILSKESEAKVAVMGCLGDKNGGVIDIGGGSSEVAVQIERELIYAKSMPLGAVRLKELAESDINNIAEQIKAKADVYQIENYNFENVSFMAVGGTATTLAQVAMGLEVYSDDKIEGYKLTKSKLAEILQEMKGKTAIEIHEDMKIEAKRAEVIYYGGRILQEIMEMFQIESVKVSAMDNLKGYAKLKRLMIN